ncbi:P-type conjugative transfer protein TrbL [Nostoc sp. 3335mG]|nr:P-type conjugative transfer protein TrbL [Nostoc sp. 3335mG]
MNNTGVIDQFLETFTRYIDSGFGLVHGDISFLTTTLIVIDVTLAGLFWAWGADEDVMHRLVKKVLYIGFFAFVIGNFNGLAKIVFESFAGLGLKAGGSQIDEATFLQPGHLAAAGIDAAQPMLDAANKMMGFTSFFANFVLIAVLMIGWLFVVLAFFILAVQVFISIIEFKLTTLAGFVLIPFALFNKTSFLAERVLGNVVASGVKILVLAVVVGIGSGLFHQFTSGFAGPVPTISEVLAILLASLALLGLGMFGPGIANGLISGGPQLGAGAAVGTALAAGGLAAVGAAGAGMAVGGTASVAGAAARGSAGLAGRASAAYRAGGAMGVARAASFGMTSPLRRAANAMRQQFSAGQSGSTTSAAASPSSGAPAWASKMRREQQMRQGAGAAVHTLRSADRGGGGASIDLSDRDR